jgi:hypothetical protein
MRKVINVDIINEDTSGAGVTIEGVRFSGGTFDGQGIGTAISKYPLQTINLVAATPYPVTTTLTTEPYSIMVLDSAGNEITASVEILVEFTGGVYVVTLESSENLSGVKLKILY